jgi:glycosyltransferase involved in cell wall biosynthesis
MDMGRAPTFSIVMPAYNAAQTIGVAIKSVLAQTRGDFELIVVNDGSTDGTAAQVEPFLSDGRVRLISQPNSGQAQARNAAIELARGTYVSLLDSDDLWLPQYLGVMAATLDADPAAAVAYTDAWVLDDELRRIARQTAMSSNQPTSVPPDADAFLRALLELGNFVFVGATIRLSVLAEAGPFRVGVEGSEDYEMWLRIAARGYRFARCPETLAIYRRRPGQMTTQLERMRRVMNDVFRIVEEEYDVPEDIRLLARQRLPMETAFVPWPPTRVPPLLRRLHEAVSRIRGFRVRPPKQVRSSFPDLRVL